MRRRAKGGLKQVVEDFFTAGNNKTKVNFPMIVDKTQSFGRVWNGKKQVA